MLQLPDAKAGRQFRDRSPSSKEAKIEFNDRIFHVLFSLSILSNNLADVRAEVSQLPLSQYICRLNANVKVIVCVWSTSTLTKLNEGRALMYVLQPTVLIFNIC